MSRFTQALFALFALSPLTLCPSALAAPNKHAHTLQGADAALHQARAAVRRLQPRRPAPRTLAGADQAVQQARAAVRRLRPDHVAHR